MPCSSPSIVASGSFIGNTGNFSSTSIYSVVSAGLYQVNYIGVIRSGSGTLDAVEIHWNDGTHNGSVGCDFPPVSSSAQPGNGRLIYAGSSTSISLDAITVGGGITYDLYYEILAL